MVLGLHGCGSPSGSDGEVALGPCDPANKLVCLHKIFIAEDYCNPSSRARNAYVLTNYSKNMGTEVRLTFTYWSLGLDAEEFCCQYLIEGST